MNWDIKLDEDGRLCEDSGKPVSEAYYLLESKADSVGICAGREAIKQAVKEGKLVPRKHQDPFTEWREACGFTEDEVMRSADFFAENHTIHWTGQKIGLYLRHPDIGCRLREYGESLPDREDRRTKFEAFRKAVTFEHDLGEWIRQEAGLVKDEPTTAGHEKLALFFRDCKESSFVFFTPENLTDKVPEALRAKFFQAEVAKLEWEQLQLSTKQLFFKKDLDGKIACFEPKDTE